MDAGDELACFRALPGVYRLDPIVLGAVDVHLQLALIFALPRDCADDGTCRSEERPPAMTRVAVVRRVTAPVASTDAWSPLKPCSVSPLRRRVP